MTAYTITGATATANVATDFTPNGIPTTGDTLTIGANKKLIIPAAYTFSAGIIMGGSSTSARSTIDIYGTLQLTTDMTANSWSDINGFSGGVFDGLSNYRCIFTASSSTNAPNKLICLGTLGNPFIFTRSDYVSGEPLPLICNNVSNGYASGLIDLKHVLIKNMASIKMGGGSGTGNHMRYENIVFADAGLFGSTTYAGLSNDFVWKNNDYRHSHVADVSGSYLIYVGCEAGVGTLVGRREYDNFTARTNDPANTKLIRFVKPDYLPDWNNTVIDGVGWDRVKNLAITHRQTNLAIRHSERTGNMVTLSGEVRNSLFICDVSHNPAKGNFHLFDNNSVTTLEDTFIEGLVHPSAATDASDWYTVPTTGTVLIQRNIVLDDMGGVFVNNLQPSGSSANVTVQNNTYLSKKSGSTYGNPYGLLTRTESGGYYLAGSSLTLQSNIVGVVNNTSSDGQVAAIFMVDVPSQGGTVSNQIDTMDYNTYWNMVSAPPTNLFRNVVTTGKTYGDVGFGGSDNYVDPMFTNYPAGNSIILAFAASKGLSTTAQVWDELLKLNGFNSATGKQESGITPAFTTADILAFARTAVTPSNPLLATSAHDGTSRGAVQFTVAPAGGGLTSVGLTSAGLTNAGLTSTGL